MAQNREIENYDLPVTRSWTRAAAVASEHNETSEQAGEPSIVEAGIGWETGGATETETETVTETVMVEGREAGGFQNMGGKWSRGSRWSMLELKCLWECFILMQHCSRKWNESDPMKESDSSLEELIENGQEGRVDP